MSEESSEGLSWDSVLVMRMTSWVEACLGVPRFRVL